MSNYTKFLQILTIIASAMIDAHRSQFDPVKKPLTGNTPSLYNGGIQV